MNNRQRNLFRLSMLYKAIHGNNNDPDVVDKFYEEWGNITFEYENSGRYRLMDLVLDREGKDEEHRANK